MPKPIGTLGTIPTLTVAGRVFTDLDNLKILRGRVADSTNSYGTFREENGSAGYTPSGLNNFRVRAIRVIGDSGSGDLYFGQSDDDVGASSAGAPTNFVPPGNSTVLGLIANLGVRNDIELPSDFLVENGKYLSLSGAATAASATVEVYGYEEA